jgi:HlyD family secretion protein
MRKRTMVLNGVLTAALALVVVLAYLTIHTTGDSATTTGSQTTRLTRGNLTSTVSANGNVAAIRDVSADFAGTAGIVRTIYVKEAQRVRKGDKIAKVDQRSARQTLRTALATLNSARAQLTTTTQGQTSQERSQDQATIASAQASVNSSRTGLRAARQTYHLDRNQQRGSVSAAGRDLGDARSSLRGARSDLRDARAEQRKAQQSGDSSDQSQAASDVAAAQSAESTAETALNSAQSALRTAEDARDSTLMQDRQNIRTQEGAVASARTSVRSARASAAVNAQPARTGEIESASAQVDSAQVTVDQARTTLNETILRAPVSGKVATINGTVGQLSSATSSSSSSSSSSTSTSTSSSGSGFVGITDVKQLQVTAMVAEADIGTVKVGQSATVTFSADGRQADATVTAIDTDDTVTNNVVEYGVTVTLDNHIARTKIGQSTSVSIATRSAQNVLIASTSALTTTGTTTTATVRRNGVDTTVTVVTGLAGDSGTEIKSGLSEGDVLVIPDQSGSSSGFTFPGGGLGGIGGGG